VSLTDHPMNHSRMARTRDQRGRVLGVWGRAAVLAGGFGVLVGCGGAEVPAARDPMAERDKWAFVQHAACYMPAVSSECQAGYQVTFGASRDLEERQRIAGTMWCEEGRAFGHFEGRDGAVTGPVAPVVWEALWRVLTQTEDCADAYGAKVLVTRKGIAHPCEAARYNIASLLNAAYYTARTGPPRKPAPKAEESEGYDERLESICAITPSACVAVDSRSPCPPFTGDPWNGIVAPEASPAEVAEAVPPEPVTDQDPCENRRRPPYGLITKAVGAVLGRARQCLPLSADVSRATMVFQSDGTVQSVAVGGWAAGKPVASCIQKALKAARVPSFLDPTFPLTVTIRPH